MPRSMRSCGERHREGCSKEENSHISLIVLCKKCKSSFSIVIPRDICSIQCPHCETYLDLEIIDAKLTIEKSNTKLISENCFKCGSPLEIIESFTEYSDFFGTAEKAHITTNKWCPKCQDWR